MHPSEEYVIVKSDLTNKVPCFNRNVYLENKSKVGIVDEIFGQINNYVIE